MLEFLKGSRSSKRTMTFEELYKTMKEMTLAADELHQLGYVHRDISPKNFLLKTDAQQNVTGVVLIDYDIALKKGEKVDPRRFYGTVGYGYPYFNGPANEQIDLYGLMMIDRELLIKRASNKGVTAEPPQSFLVDAHLIPPSTSDTTLKQVMKDRVDWYSSPYSNDPSIPKELSAISFWRFKTVAEKLEALERAKLAHQSNDPDLFFSWFYEKHLSKLSKDDFENLKANSTEIREATQKMMRKD